MEDEAQRKVPCGDRSWKERKLSANIIYSVQPVGGGGVVCSEKVGDLRGPGWIWIVGTIRKRGVK